MTALFRALCLSALLLSVPAVAQDDIPRRADGRPDLSGMYDIATLTPFMRPPQYGERLALTQKEAEDLAAHWQASFEKDYQKSDPDREAPPEGGVAFACRDLQSCYRTLGNLRRGDQLADRRFQ